MSCALDADYSFPPPVANEFSLLFELEVVNRAFACFMPSDSHHEIPSESIPSGFVISFCVNLHHSFSALFHSDVSSDIRNWLTDSGTTVLTIYRTVTVRLTSVLFSLTCFPNLSQ